MNIFIWQRIVSPHMADLATSLASSGCNITYVTEALTDSDRANLGWSIPNLNNISLRFILAKKDVRLVIANAPDDSIHICQGLRGNGLISYALALLVERGLKYSVIMETVDDSGVLGFFKRLEYSRLFKKHRNTLQGVLAIGYKTGEWISNCGLPQNMIFPFTYFLRKKYTLISTFESNTFRFIFVGNLIHRKRLDILFDVLYQIRQYDFELIIVGTGKIERKLKKKANQLIPGKVKWRGVLPIEDVPKEISKADCLVLPSRHDGWGVVVSEALMVGTQVICSDACGSAGVVEASKYGRVFVSGDRIDLRNKITQILSGGKMTPESRHKLIDWSKCLSADSGSEYLLGVLQFLNKKSMSRPESWLKNN